MPQVELTDDLRNRMLRRVMVFGAPNTFKTTAALLTSYYPMAIVCPPGESGWGTIPSNVKGLQTFIWQEEPSDPVSAESMRTEVEGTVFKLIAGHYGPIRTLVIDGYHQMYNSIYLNIATAGLYGQGEDFKAQLYGRAHRMSERFLRKTINSPIEYLTFTTWNAKEMDRAKKPGEQASDVESHEWPDLPGKAAKEMVGKFSVVVFSKIGKKKLPDGRLVGEWLLKPDADVWGASTKMDPRLIQKLPGIVPQDFKNLYKVIGAAQQEVEREDSAAVA